MLVGSTFWDVFFLLLIWIPLITLWIFALADIFRRRDMRGASKALWVACVVFVPWLGTFIYLLSRPQMDVALDDYAQRHGEASPPRARRAASGQTIPSSCPRITASSRVWTPRRPISPRTWFRTVSTEMPSDFAMFSVEWPAAT